MKPRFNNYPTYTASVFLFCYFICAGAFAQNLVMNPGFESFHCKRWYISSIENCDDWISPSFESPDYFNGACEELRHMDIAPERWWGEQAPHSGNAYIGIIGYRPAREIDEIKAEYVEGKLVKPLSKDTKYTVKINVSLAECSSLSLQNLHIYFSETEIKKKKTSTLRFKPQLIFDLSAIDTVNWLTLNQTFIAKGNEQYFIIGCFIHKKKMHYKKVHPSKKISQPRNEAYYFIDDVSVVADTAPGDEAVLEKALPLKTNADMLKPVEQPSRLPAIGAPVILKNVFFENDKHELLPASFEELNKLIRLLESDRSIKITINGYTDNSGKSNDNLVLSLNRAKSVYDYLVLKGIAPERLSYNGFGDKNPVASNSTEEGREKNRRVEFMVTE